MTWNNCLKIAGLVPVVISGYLAATTGIDTTVVWLGIMGFIVLAIGNFPD